MYIVDIADLYVLFNLAVGVVGVSGFLRIDLELLMFGPMASAEVWGRSLQ